MISDLKLGVTLEVILNAHPPPSPSSPQYRPKKREADSVNVTRGSRGISNTCLSIPYL